MNEKPYDLVAFGATSFVGTLLCRYLTDEFGFDGRLRWAAAGRSQSKLEGLRSSLGEAAAALPIEIADAADEAALAAICNKTHAVVSTVGPYAFYGEPLIKVCAATGTDYCDLTGEVPWIKRMIGLYEAKAQASGARIVHCCGFDSIPSDMGVTFLQEEARRRFGLPCSHVKMRVKAIQGGASGGTIASILNVAKEVAASPELRKELANPYALCPPNEVPKVRQASLSRPEYDPDFDSWLAPFVMATINTKVVHRSNALSNYGYGRDFLYDEAMLVGQGLEGRAKAYAIGAGFGAFAVASVIPPARWALERFILPAPGEGPSSESQNRGFFDLKFLGKNLDGRTIRGKVTGDADPGYLSTSKMLGQAAACLVSLDKSEKPGGFWTPATCFGDRLVEALKAHAGITFEVLEG
jgi:short subunit dehydrogenase-like uncharacterized protein